MVILVEPRIPGNIGAVARAMKNFDVKELVLVNPQCDYCAPEVGYRAKHAQDVLKKMKVVASFADVRKTFDCLVATTSKIGSDYNIARSPLAPEDCAALLQKRKKVGLVFGSENEGLHNTEVHACDFVVSIPTAKKYPALNLSHAVAILLYALFLAAKKENSTSHITFASQQEKETLLKLVHQKIERLPFSTASKRRTQYILWKRLIGKSFLTKREVFALFGFFKKVK